MSLGGDINPPNWPQGRAGLRPDAYFSTGIEPKASSAQTTPATPYPPPGIWHFYTYWPEMRSWQTPAGIAINSNSAYYGNNFEPKEAAPVPRGRWIAVEIMVKMNTTPEDSDGEQAMWIDGKLVARFGPGTVKGHWLRDNYYIDGNDAPFEGIRWRNNSMVNINEVWLSHYADEDAFVKTDAYRIANPDAVIDPSHAVVWFDDRRRPPNTSAPSPSRRAKPRRALHRRRRCRARGREGGRAQAWSRRHTTAPFTTVAMGPPRKSRPSNGVFRLLENEWLTSYLQVRSVSKMVISAGAPGESVPAFSFRMRAGPAVNNSTIRAMPILPE